MRQQTDANQLLVRIHTIEEEVYLRSLGTSSLHYAQTTVGEECIYNNCHRIGDSSYVGLHVTTKGAAWLFCPCVAAFRHHLVGEACMGGLAAA